MLEVNISHPLDVWSQIDIDAGKTVLFQPGPDGRTGQEGNLAQES